MASAERLIEVFNEARARPPGAERDQFVVEACREDVDLRQQVMSLLEAEAEENRTDFLRNTLIVRPDRVTEQPGDRIGRYKLLQQLGEGGCGVVYMAEQEEPVRRRVALKVIKLGMDTKSVIARFEAERQALALMDHPNIAKVLDAGATETGRPFFVMELVRGIKITDYCDQNNLTTEQRLELFTQVCHAVQHAHQKGIIHRDLKPSNILVTLHDGVPVPKVIDFGVAKATTDQRLTDKTVFTAFEQFIGTPAYMSPEQAEMSGLDIDTRSDIYSLGVLLYELLTGKTPLDPEELLRSGMNEMRRKIREEEPPRPSTRLSTMQAGDLTSTAKLRQSDPPKLIHLVRGDLDWIVMRCLEKERARRYETANGLASDIQRHLKHEPVSARPPTRLYRFRKLVQRNKLAFAAVGVLAFALVIVAVGSAAAAWRVANAQRAEQRERQKAETANRQLRQTVSLLELERVEDSFSANDAALGVAQLAAMLRRDPSNSIAANRLVSALTQRSWALPVGTPMRHADRATMAAFSPDGLRVFSASWDKTVRVCEVSSSQAAFTLHHADRVSSASYSLDGQKILTTADGTVQIWNAATGAALFSLRHSDTVHWAEFSRDSAFVVTACADKSARIWDAATGEMKHALPGHESPVVVARFSPDGVKVITGTGGSLGSVRAWNAESGEMLFKLEDRNRPVTSLAISRDGQRLACARDDGVVKIWNATTGEPGGAPLVHQKVVWHAEFSPDSKLLLTACEDGAARLWDVQTMQSVGEPLRHESGVIFGAFSPDGQSVVTTSSDNTARVWDVRTQTPLCQPLRDLERVLHAGFSPDGRRLVTASYAGVAQIWELGRRLEPSVQIQQDRNVVPVALTPDGFAILTAGHNKTLRLWDVRTGQPLSEPMPQEWWFTAGDFASDGRRVAVAFTDDAVRIWDCGDWKSVRRTLISPRLIAGPLQHSKRIHSVRFSADASRIVTASADGTACVWDSTSGQPVTPSLIHKGEVVTAQFSRDGRRVVTASEDHTARIWDAQNGRALLEPLTHLDHVKWAEFSPDGERVATASTDNTACLWDARTGRKLLTLQHARIVVRAVFSPDGRRIITASLDRTAQIWDANTGQALTPPLRHDAPVDHVRFSSDARRVFTASWGGPGRVWDSDTGRPVTEWLSAGTFFSSAFEPVSGRVMIGTQEGVLHLWDLPEAALPVPGWFPKFAEALAGVRLGERGAMELVPREELETFVNPSASSTASNQYEQLARRFLASSQKAGR